MGGGGVYAVFVASRNRRPGLSLMAESYPWLPLLLALEITNGCYRCSTFWSIHRYGNKFEQSDVMRLATMHMAITCGIVISQHLSKNASYEIQKAFSSEMYNARSYLHT